MIKIFRILHSRPLFKWVISAIQFVVPPGSTLLYTMAPKRSKPTKKDIIVHWYAILYSSCLILLHGFLHQINTLCISISCKVMKHSLIWSDDLLLNCRSTMANKGVLIEASKTVKIDEWHGYLYFYSSNPLLLTRWIVPKNPLTLCLNLVTLRLLSTINMS